MIHGLLLLLLLLWWWLAVDVDWGCNRGVDADETLLQARDELVAEAGLGLVDSLQHV